MSDQGLARQQLPTDLLVGSMPGPGLRAPDGRAHRIPKIRGRAQEVAAMTTWRRWQDWVVVALGVITFLTPFVFGDTSQTVAASTAYVVGVLIALGGLLNAAMSKAGGLQLIPALLARVLFSSPFSFALTVVGRFPPSPYPPAPPQCPPP